MHHKFLQEDVPDEFASLIINFISRNRIGPHGVEVGCHDLISCYIISGDLLQSVILFVCECFPFSSKARSLYLKICSCFMPCFTQTIMWCLDGPVDKTVYNLYNLYVTSKLV